MYSYLCPFRKKNKKKLNYFICTGILILYFISFYVKYSKKNIIEDYKDDV